MSLQDVASLAGGAVMGAVTALVTHRVKQARTDARLTWLEDAQGASLRVLVRLADYLNARDERQELVSALSKAPRVRG